MIRLAALVLSVAAIVGCGEKADPTAAASPSAGKATFAPTPKGAGARSNPVANYKTAPAGQGDALK